MHQNVQAAVAFGHRLLQALHVRLVGNIAADGTHATRLHRVEFVLAPAAYDDLKAVALQA